MALTDRQRRLYRQECTIWRFDYEVDAEGVPSAKSWSQVATGVPCYFQSGMSQHLPAGFLLGESDNMFTFDTVHFEAAVDVRSGDILKQTTGPQAGNFWTARGNDRTRDMHANKLMVLCSKTEQVPAGVS